MFINYYKTIDRYSDICMTSDGCFLTGLWFKDSKDDIKHKGNYKIKDLPIFEETKKWLDIYFSGIIPDFTPNYKLENLTPFRNLVMEELKKIPYGSVVTYGDIARNVASIKCIKKMSAQAIGGAVAANPICIIIPCHRVIGKNSRLVGFSSGIQNKIELLKLENKENSNIKY